MTVTCVSHHSHVRDTSMYYSDNTFTMYTLTFQGVCGLPLLFAHILILISLYLNKGLFEN